MKFLFVISAETHYRELKRLCQCIHAIQPQEYFFYNTIEDSIQIYSAPPVDEKIIKNCNVDYSYWENVLPVLKVSFFKNWIPKILKYIKQLIKKCFPSVLACIEQWLILRHKSKVFKGLLREHTVDIVVLAEANVCFSSELYAKTAAKLGLPCIITPYTLCSPDEPALFYSENRLYRVTYIEKCLLTLLGLKHWIYDFKNYHLLRLPYPQVFALALSRMTPPKPWVQESSAFAYVISESPYAKDHYQHCGIEPRLIVELGGYGQDLVYLALQEKSNIREDLLSRFSKQKPLIVCAFPGDYVGKIQYHSEFCHYDALIDYWLTILKNQTEYNVVINLHPVIKDKQKFYEHECENLIVSEKPIYQLLAIADIYISCISATIKWAISLGIPIINYDVYNFNYKDYEKCKGVVTVNTKINFEREFYKIVKDAAYRENLADHNKRDSNLWGKIDGSFGRKFLEFCENQLNASKTFLPSSIEKRQETQETWVQ